MFPDRSDEFDWDSVKDDIVVPEQAQIAVYTNPKDDVVIRQAGRFGPDEDQFVYVAPCHAKRLAEAVLRQAGLNLAIVPWTQVIITNGGGEILRPFPDEESVKRMEDIGSSLRETSPAALRQRKYRNKNKPNPASATPGTTDFIDSFDLVPSVTPVTRDGDNAARDVTLSRAAGDF